MSAGLSRSQVEAVAALANLELTEPELDLFGRQLGDILEYANQLQRIDTTGIPPTSSIVARQAGPRADEVRPSLDRGDAIANAPDANVDAGLFRVPRVIG